MREDKGFSRDSFKWFATIPTRWIDMDIYGHVNNVQYYSYFDTAIAEHLIEAGKLDPKTADIIGLVVETSCTFKKSIGFPADVNAGIRVVRVGRTSLLEGRYMFSCQATSAPEAQKGLGHTKT